MEATTLYSVTIQLLMPIFSAVCCGILVGFSYGDCLSMEERSLKRMLLVYLFFSALGWFVAFCYEFWPKLFVWLNVPCLLSFTLPSILFYRIIRFLTRLGQPESFSWGHYLVPGILAIIMFVWSLFVPYGAQLEIVQGKAQVFPAGYEAYAHFFVLKPPLRVVVGVVYYVLTILLLIHYFKRATDKDTLVRQPANWVIFLVGISSASLFSSLLPSFMPRDRIYYSIWMILVSFSIAIQHVLLSYHIIRRKYLLYVVPEKNYEPEQPEELPKKRERRLHSGKISVQRLEDYFRNEKPYLNPDYNLNDLVEAMDVNRTVMSTFINRTYGTSFPRYLNGWRLRELERLRNDPANKGKTVTALIDQTGFGEYRKYARAIAAEQKETEKRKRVKRKEARND